MTNFNCLDYASHESLAAFIAKFPESCDPEFDCVTDDLEREFAELRLTFGNP